MAGGNKRKGKGGRIFWLIVIVGLFLYVREKNSELSAWLSVNSARQETKEPGDELEDTLQKLQQMQEALDEMDSVQESAEEEEPHWALKGKGGGVCNELTGEVVITFFFVDEPDYKWTDEARSNVKKDYANSINSIMEDAVAYGVALNVNTYFKNASVATNMERSEYRASVEEVMKNSALPAVDQFSESVSTSLGAKEAPVIFCYNKPGRCFAAMRYDKGVGGEYAIMYAEGTSVYTFKHELYHVFGAQDLYGSGGVNMEGVNEIAARYWPDSIMLNSSEGAGKTDPLTAYVLGWTAEPSEDVKLFLQETEGLSEEQLEDKSNIVGDYGTEENAHGVYTGSFKNGLRDGSGRMEYTDGAVYDGNWKNGSWNGYGEWLGADGSSHIGTWEEGLAHGQGKHIYADGGCYEGDFVLGKREGRGKYTYPDGAVYEGAWIQNERTGYGKLAYPNSAVYEGDWLEGKQHGHGKMQYADGAVYEGNFHEGYVTGYGHFTYTDGSSYQGDFVSGERHGSGTYYYSNGACYEGQWQNGERHGYGKMTYANGTAREGNWNQGQFAD